MIDVKKLITGFLVLTAGVGAMVFIIGSFSGASAGNNDAATAIATAQSNPAITNAFATPSTIGDPGQLIAETSDDDDPALASETSAIANDPNNLTNTLAESYLTGLMYANPDGLQSDQDGSQSLTPPNDTQILDEFTNTAALNSINIPDWDVEADQIPVTVASTYSSSTLSNYSAAIQSIFSQDFVQTNLTSMLNGNTDPSAATYAAGQIQSALQDIAGLQTPEPAVAFQKSLIKILVYEKDTLALIENDTVDPVKTALILQAESVKYNAALQNFQTQFQAISMLPEFSPVAQAPETNPVGIMALVDNALGIQTAHAIFGLGDIDFDPTTFGQMLLNYANNIALQIVKNFIVHEMQTEVLKWVQGSGAPQFVTNWASTIINAYEQTALNALNSQYQCIRAAPFAAQVKLSLGAYYQPNSNVCSVQFNSLLSQNLTQFENHFSTGGWLTFGQTMQPDNNYYGTLFFTAQTVGYSGQFGQQSAQTKAVANQGWVGQDICSDGTSPITGCKPGDILNGSGQCIGSGNQTYNPTNVQNGLCANGQAPQTVQPGQVVGQVFNSAVDSSGNLTAAANDIAGLLDSFLTSLLNSIATNLITTTGGALNSLGSSGTGGTTSGGSQSGAIDLSCTGILQSKGPDVVQFEGAGGQVISLTASGTITSTPAPSYSWSVPGGSPSSGTGGSFVTRFNVSSTYAAVMTDENPADAINGVQPSTTCTVTAP